MTDLLVSEGYADVGYEYVNVDDCWLEKSRDPVTKRLVEDRRRFPNGMKSLGQYVNIYLDSQYNGKSIFKWFKFLQSPM